MVHKPFNLIIKKSILNLNLLHHKTNNSAINHHDNFEGLKDNNNGCYTEIQLWLNCQLINKEFTWTPTFYRGWKASTKILFHISKIDIANVSTWVDSHSSNPSPKAVSGPLFLFIPRNFPTLFNKDKMKYIQNSRVDIII